MIKSLIVARKTIITNNKYVKQYRTLTVKTLFERFDTVVQANAILDFRISKTFDTIRYEEILIAIKISKFLGRLSVVFSIR